MRLRIAEKMDQSQALLDELSVAEAMARKLDVQEMTRLRVRSMVSSLKWGDAPTKYFFNQLKAKQAREYIQQL